MSTFSALLRHFFSFDTVAQCLYFFLDAAPWQFFYDAAPCPFIPCCCVMSALTTLLHHVYLFHAATLCLLFPRCFTLSTAICLLFPHCCAMSTFSTLLSYVNFYMLLCLPFFTLLCNVSFIHAAAPCLIFLASALYLLFPRWFAMSTLSTLLCRIYFFHAATPCLLFPHCFAISTFSTLLRHVYSFHTASPYLLFPRCCAMSTLSTKLRHVYFSTLPHHV